MPFSESSRRVEESYGRHLAAALYVGWRMLGRAVACFIYGLFPFLFAATGSRTIKALHAEICARTERPAPGLRPVDAAGRREPYLRELPRVLSGDLSGHIDRRVG